MIVCGQITSGTTSAQSVCVVPPGPCTVVVTNAAAHPVFIGVSSSVTHSNGFEILNGSPPVKFTTYVGSTGAHLWAISQTTAGVVSFLLSTSG
jgi:hypothetical protein